MLWWCWLLRCQSQVNYLFCACIIISCWFSSLIISCRHVLIMGWSGMFGLVWPLTSVLHVNFTSFWYFPVIFTTELNQPSCFKLVLANLLLFLFFSLCNMWMFNFCLISSSMLAVSSFRQEDKCQTCLPLHLYITLSLALSLSLSFCPSSSTNPCFPLTAVLACSAPWSETHENKTHTLTHHHTATHTHTHLSLSSCRTRGGEKRVEEFGLKSCNCLQTAGKVQLMFVCLSSVPPLFLSVCLCLSCHDL